jgi:hypothetical protein
VDDNKEGAIAGKRPIAKGAVSRVRKRRAKEWKRRHDTDTEGEEVCPSSFTDGHPDNCTPRKS